jgi:hypothetical protein
MPPGPPGAAAAGFSAFWRRQPKSFKYTNTGASRIWERFRGVNQTEKPKADQEASDSAQAARSTPPNAKSIGRASRIKKAP